MIFWSYPQVAAITMHVAKKYNKIKQINKRGKMACTAAGQMC